MAFRRKRVFFRKRRTRRFFRRRFFRGRKSVRGRTRHKGYVRNYKRAAFVGRKTMPYRKFFRSTMNKRLIQWNVQNTFTNVNTAGQDNAWIFMPVSGLTQTTGFQEGAVGADPYSALPIDQFTGDTIYLTGVKLDFLIVSEASQDFYLRIMCFWAHQDQNILGVIGDTSPLWANWQPTGTNANSTAASPSQAFYDPFRFLDLPYSSGVGYGNYANITTRPNPNYPGKLLFDYKKKMTCTANITTAGGNPSMAFSRYFPFRQLFKFSTTPFFQSSLETQTNLPLINSLGDQPNVGKHGQPVFVIYYANTLDLPAAGTEQSIAIAGNSCVYFKNIGT